MEPMVKMVNQLMKFGKKTPANAGKSEDEFLQL